MFLRGGGSGGDADVARVGKPCGLELGSFLDVMRVLADVSADLRQAAGVARDVYKRQFVYISQRTPLSAVTKDIEAFGAMRDEAIALEMERATEMCIRDSSYVDKYDNISYVRLLSLNKVV